MILKNDKLVKSLPFGNSLNQVTHSWPQPYLPSSIGHLRLQALRVTESKQGWSMSPDNSLPRSGSENPLQGVSSPLGACLKDKAVLRQSPGNRGGIGRSHASRRDDVNARVWRGVLGVLSHCPAPGTQLRS